MKGMGIGRRGNGGRGVLGVGFKLELSGSKLEFPGFKLEFPGFNFKNTPFTIAPAECGLLSLFKIGLLRKKAPSKGADTK
ncbi:MAG: hypothetical protein C6Y22_12225 [Hapalosiphonaceae cyanobacterium JJU2]|nr:MAG: hypothetical protein C6Y22_12225 [Hapalosiphonaceae cyanobacterium JJU2]